MTQMGISQVDWVFTNFAQFEKGLNGQASSPFHRVRKEAFAQFTRLGFPKSNQEEWKYTNVSELAQDAFSLPERGVRADVSLEVLSSFAPVGLEAYRLVFVDGQFSKDHSTLDKLPQGLVLGSLAQITEGAESPYAKEVEQHLSRYASFQENSFNALNTAFTRDGAFIGVAAGCTIETPVQILFLMTANRESVVSHPRLLVIAGAGSQLTLIENYIGLGDKKYFTNPVSEFVIAEGALVDHYKIQQESPAAYHIGALHAEIKAKANFRTHVFSFGGQLVRNEINPVLSGDGIECIMNGLSVIGGQQHVDNHTCIDHAKPHCHSTELFKGVYAGKSAGVFNGTIIVRPGAQKTNAIQSNQSLLLSKEATIDSKPQLKIWADDVRCTHGATVGQIDQEGLFYLRSRGIGVEEARHMLIHAFASDVISSVKIAELRVKLEALLLSKLRSSTGISDLE